MPHGIFPEQTDVDPDTLANRDPLRRLAGRWRAQNGVDLGPKPDGAERRVSIDTIDCQAIDPQANGPQLFYGLHDHLHIMSEEEDIPFTNRLDRGFGT
jgi:hypothetical protein